jgi:hypothetical protein
MYMLFALTAVLFFLTIPPFAACQSPTMGLAVMNVKAIGIPETAALALTETFHSTLHELVSIRKPPELTDSYDLIERSQMDKIFDQFQIQYSGCSDEKCAVEFGKMFSVQRIIISSVGLVGETYTVQVRLVDVESSRIIRSVSRNLAGKIDGVIDLLARMGYELLTGPKTVHIALESVPPGAAAILDGKSCGFTPLRGFQTTEGDHELSLHMPGYETHRQILAVRASQKNPSTIMLLPKSRRRAFTKSLLLPGSGQWYAGRQGKSTLISAFQLVAIAGVVGASLAARHANDDYEKARADYRSITLAEKWRIPEAGATMSDSYDKASDATRLQHAAIGIAAAVYIGNCIDAAFTDPKTEGKTGITLGTGLAPFRNGDRMMSSLSLRVRF